MEQSWGSLLCRPASPGLPSVGCACACGPAAGQWAQLAQVVLCGVLHCQDQPLRLANGVPCAHAGCLCLAEQLAGAHASEDSSMPLLKPVNWHSAGLYLASCHHSWQLVTGPQAARPCRCRCVVQGRRQRGGARPEGRLGRLCAHSPAAGWRGRIYGLQPAGRSSSGRNKAPLCCAAASTAFTEVQLSLSDEDRVQSMLQEDCIPALLQGCSASWEAGCWVHCRCDGPVLLQPGHQCGCVCGVCRPGCSCWGWHSWQLSRRCLAAWQDCS